MAALTLASASEGGCLCSAIRYLVSDAPIATGLCHCRSCQLATGATRVAWVVVKRQGFQFTRGRAVEFRSSPHVTRTFCGKCGTSLTYQHDESPESIDITTATFDHPELFAPVREVWLDHKVSWEPENAALAHYPKDRVQENNAT